MSDVTNENIIDAMQREIDALEAQLEQFRTDVTEFSVSQDMAGTTTKAQQRLQSIISSYGQQALQEQK